MEQRRLSAPRRFVALFDPARADPLFAAAGIFHIAFNVPAARFEDAAASIRASGAAVWQDNRSEGASLYFLDPDGHKLEIHAGDWRTRLAGMKKEPWEENIQYFD